MHGTILVHLQIVLTVLFSRNKPLTLAAIEKYIRNTIIQGLSVIDDLMSEVLKKPTPSIVEESISNFQDILVILSTVKKKKLSSKFRDFHYES